MKIAATAGVIMGLAILQLGSTPSLADDKKTQPDATPMSTGTSQLLNLIHIFDQLNDAVANRIERNERHLLALAMIRLESGFYGLSQAKQRFVISIEEDQPLTNFEAYSETVRQLRESVKCFAEQFADDGHRIFALTQIDGPKVAENLQKGLGDKIGNLKQLADDLGIHAPADDLKKTILTDAQRAEDTAKSLAAEAGRFAHVLDANVMAPQHPTPCVRHPG